MSEHRLSDGRDTYTQSNRPQATPHQENRIMLTSGGPTSYGYVQFGRLATIARGKRVVVARLSPRAAAAQPGQRITVVLPASRYNLGKLKWADRPENRPGLSVTEDVPAVAAGERFYVDVATLVQAIADGAADWGFRVGTSATGQRIFYSFDAAVASWVLELVLAEPSDAPTALDPASGTVGTPRPALTWDGDLDQADLHVQVDPNANGDNPAFDSGTVASTKHEYNLATSSYAGASAGTPTQWRVRTRAAGEEWSQWSDWVGFTYRPLGALGWTSPAAGEVYDPSPVVGGQLASGSIRRFQVIVTDPATGATLYDSGEISMTPAAAFEHQVPTTHGGRPVFTSGVGRRVELRAWDAEDRRATTGVPAYSTATKTVTLAAGTAQPPVLVTITQTEREPELRARLERPAAPDTWVIERALGVGTGWGAAATALRSDAGAGDLVPAGAGVYEWLDRTARMSGRVRYRAATITNGAASAFTPWVVVEPIVEGVWIVRANGERFKLENDQVSLSMTERRTSLSPPGIGYDIEDVTALGGYAGEVSGTVDTNTTPGLDVALGIIETLWQQQSEVVRLVHRSVNVPVTLRALDWAPDPERYTPTRRCHAVSFGVQQVDEFVGTL